MPSSLHPKTKLAVNLRIAVIQLNPQIAQVAHNVSRANILLNKLSDGLKNCPTERHPDLVVFPEFALTGYNFRSREHILPYTSRAKDGPSFDLARKVSQMFSCYTIIGYPERASNDNDTKLYNSAIVVDPAGELVFNYRKSFLYYTDDDWGCQENPLGFQSFPLFFRNRARDLSNDREENLVDVTLKSSIGICMDLSPYKFEAPFQDFEFATYNIDNNNELIVCPMAWLHSCSVTSDSESEVVKKMAKIEEYASRQGLPIHGSQGNFQVDLNCERKVSITSNFSESSLNAEYTDLSKPDITNINYWILRFSPMLALKQRHRWSVADLVPFIENAARMSYMGSTVEERWKFKNNNSIVVMANRCGIEDGKTVFAGSSGIYKFNGKYDTEEADLDSSNRSVELLGNLGKGMEGAIIRDVEFEVVR